MRQIVLLAIVMVLVCGPCDLEAGTQDTTETTHSAAAKRILKYQRKARQFMERAHPTPMNTKGGGEFLPYILPAPSEHFLFDNKSLIADESDPQPMQNESSIAVNPTDPSNLIASAVDYRANSSTWVYVSQDGGRSWENINLGHPFPNWRSTNDPSVAFGADGRGYLVYGGFGDPQIGQNGVFMSFTTDKGRNWTTHIPIILHTAQQNEDSSFEDKYYIESDNATESPYFGNLYCPWKRVVERDSSTQIVLARSTDKGLTWLPPVPVSDRVVGSDRDTTFGLSFPISTTGPKGELYVAWNWGPEKAVGFNKSTDGGLSFGEPRIIHRYDVFGVARRIPEGGDSAWRHTLKGGVRAEAYPTIQCDESDGPRSGWLYLCWAADPVPNIYFSRSTDGGDTWSNPILVHEEPTNDQFWPWLSIDPTNGDLAVMYLDSRDDPANLAINCYVSYSSDGGDTWVDRRVGDSDHDLRLNPFAGNSFSGDYSGNAFYNGIVYPSWFDTRRGTALNSDVYTAIVNIRQPRPVRNAAIEVFPERSKELRLTWEAPKSRVMDQELADEEFSYTVWRNGSLLRDKLTAAEIVLNDATLNPHQEYRYEIAVVAGSDTSRRCALAAFAGGSRKPDVPDLRAVRGESDNTVKLDVFVPGLRSDSITPLVNAHAVRIYRDGELVEERQIDSDDTSSVVSISDKPVERGYYHYRVTLIDKAEPPNESDLSDELFLYTGPVEQDLRESFDGASLPRYYLSGGWERTEQFALSPRYSMTESLDGDYRANERDTMLLFPVTAFNFDRYALEFWHAALIHPSDTGFVDMARNGLDNWETIAAFNSTDYEPWQDGSLNNDDWKLERLFLDAQASDTVYLRFRFRSNVIRNAEGWFVDDLRLAVVSSVRESAAPELALYPNPAHSRLTLRSNDPLLLQRANFTIIDVLGRQHQADNISRSEHSLTIEIASLAPGAYLLRIQTESGVQTLPWQIRR